MTYRIHRSATPDTVVFALSGDMNGEHATRLQEFLGNEADGRVALDLKDVTLVDRAMVRFFAGAETAGGSNRQLPRLCAQLDRGGEGLATETRFGQTGAGAMSCAYGSMGRRLSSLATAKRNLIDPVTYR